MSSPFVSSDGMRGKWVGMGQDSPDEASHAAKTDEASQAAQTELMSEASAMQSGMAKQSQPGATDGTASSTASSPYVGI